MDDDCWIRLPDEGERCKVSGLSRTGLSELLEEADPLTGEKYVISLRKQKPGATRAVRLINKKSLQDYLRRTAEDQRGYQWASHITNPHCYSIDDVLSDVELFLCFLGPDNEVTERDWSIGKLSSRRARLAALLAVGSLVQTDPKEK
jgi:hypothetical protein